MLFGKMNKEDKAQGGLWGDMSGRINKVETIWYNSKLGERTALSNKKTSQSADKNFYEPHFKQGATIVPPRVPAGGGATAGCRQSSIHPISADGG